MNYFGFLFFKKKISAVQTFQEVFGLGMKNLPTANFDANKNLLCYKLMSKENEDYLVLIKKPPSKTKRLFLLVLNHYFNRACNSDIISE